MNKLNKLRGDDKSPFMFYNIFCMIKKGLNLEV